MTSRHRTGVHRHGWRSRSRWAAVTAAALLATVVPVVTPPAAVAEPVAPIEWPHGDDAVTLITGDRVTVRNVDGTPQRTVTPAEGREHIRFVTRQIGGDLHVIPEDAGRLIADGVLDRRFFDITTLVAWDYQDGARDDIPLLVRSAESLGLASTGRLSSLGLATARQPKESAAAAWRELVAADGVSTLAAGDTRIWLDGRRSIALDTSVGRIGAPEAWEAGYTGEGVTVAVLDTGVDANHPDLAGRLTEVRNFTEMPDATDPVGHGTHVASTIAGTGAASDGRYTGVAPGANLLVGKVCEYDWCMDSAILAGMEWAARSGADVVNMSLGGPDGPEVDPLEQAVTELTAEYGTLFVVSAGNEGTDLSVESPGSAAVALSVGAVDDADSLADFSSRGPRVGDHALKPDLTAPGVGIVAARAAGTEMGEPVGDGYVAASGTSMATPHVAGAVALLAQRHPDWTPERLKAHLMGSARPNPDLAPYQQGAGRVDVAAAVTGRVHATPPSVSAGLAAWPRQPGSSVVTPVTYHNTSDVDVTLDVRATGAPAGMVTLSAGSVTVPAGGDATVEVTVEPTAGDVGFHGAVITATGGDTTVVTPLHLTNEGETYTVTSRVVDRNGDPAAGAAAMTMNPATGEYHTYTADADGVVAARLPVGSYHFDVGVYTPLPDGEASFSLLLRPLVEVTGDVELTFDTREAAAVTAEVTDVEPAPLPTRFEFSYQREGDVMPMGATVSNVLDRVYIGAVGEPVPGDEFWSLFSGHFIGADDAGEVDPAGPMFLVGLEVDGVPVGYDLRLGTEDFAKVSHRYRAQGAHTLGMQSWTLVVPQRFGFGYFADITTPGERVDYVTPTDRAEWSSGFTQLDEVSGEAVFDEERPSTDYRAGGTYRSEWNTAVFGPAVASVSRDGDALSVYVPMFGGLCTTGGSMVDSGFTRLYRGDTLLGESDRHGSGDFTGLSDGTGYRLVTEARRGADVSPFSTVVGVEWAFTARDGLAPTLLSVAFAPRGLDEANHVAAGERVSVPVAVTNTTGDRVRPAALAVEVSFDDGETWREVTLRYGGVSFRTPEGTGTVSLRATAFDADGGSVTQTVIDAFGYR
ncbi:S8 family serine peptidase [Stackebrandtia albiflava]|nr:S8 family serine peptidase [Stackebrandtia albiflava]